MKFQHTLGLNSITNKMDLTDFYRTLLPPNTEEYTFHLINPWKFFQDCSHIRKKQVSKSLRKFKFTLSDHKGMEMDIKNDLKSGKYAKSQKLNSTPVNANWLRRENKKELGIKNILQMWGANEVLSECVLLKWSEPGRGPQCLRHMGMPKLSPGLSSHIDTVCINHQWQLLRPRWLQYETTSLQKPSTSASVSSSLVLYLINMLSS